MYPERACLKPLQDIGYGAANYSKNVLAHGQTGLKKRRGLAYETHPLYATDWVFTVASSACFW